MNIDDLERILPHGSGINYTWFIDDKGKYLRAFNSFDTMNENGMYDSVVDFSIIVPKKNPMDFKIHFHSNRYYAEKYMLRNYLEDTIALYIDDYLNGD